VKDAAKEVEAAEQKVSASHVEEVKASAALEVKASEAQRLTEECSLLRSEVALLREKAEASTGIINALGASCEKLKSELAAAQNARAERFQMFQLALSQQDVPVASESNLGASDSPEKSGISLEEIEQALSTAPEVEQKSTAAEGTAALSAPMKRRRTKGPEVRAAEAALAEIEVAQSGHVTDPTRNVSDRGTETESLVTMRRLRSKTAAADLEKTHNPEDIRDIEDVQDLD